MMPMRAALLSGVRRAANDTYSLGHLFFQAQDAPVFVGLHHPGRDPHHGAPFVDHGSVCVESPRAVSTSISVYLSESVPGGPSPIRSSKPRGIDTTTLSPHRFRLRVSRVASSSALEELLCR